MMKEVTVFQYSDFWEKRDKFIQKYQIKDSFTIENDDEEITNTDFAEDARSEGLEIVYYQNEEDDKEVIVKNCMLQRRMIMSPQKHGT
jgi:hypothetical protein